jgi:D-cysteine desulfhydrase family pyridoxal phosphate-dependent enzyme
MTVTETLAAFPRTALTHRPTPVEFMPNLSAAVGGVDLYVKRDDCTGLAMGGNKARQLEFYLGEALEQGASAVLITGAVQSNYVRSTAAAAAKLGLRCIVQLEQRVPDMPELYHRSGNVLLDHVLGAEVRTFPEGENEAGADAELERMAAELAAAGERPYVIHLSGGHPPLGALGYVDAATEIVEQATSMQIDFGTVVVPSGSAMTHAGLLVGLRALGAADLRVIGVCVRRSAAAQRERVHQCAVATAGLLQMDLELNIEDIEVTDDFLGPGYGRIGPAGKEAILQAARHEGLLLDPVYTGKAFACFLDYAASGALGDRPALFVHTGGTPALFGYGAGVAG